MYPLIVVDEISKERFLFGFAINLANFHQRGYIQWNSCPKVNKAPWLTFGTSFTRRYMPLATLVSRDNMERWGRGLDIFRHYFLKDTTGRQTDEKIHTDTSLLLLRVVSLAIYLPNIQSYPYSNVI